MKELDRAAGQAETAFADRDQGQDPTWVTYFDASEYYATLGICYQIAARTSDPGRARRSVDMIGHALAYRDPSRVRSRAFDYLGLARAHLAAGELESAEVAGRAALELTGKVSSTRVHHRLYELLREIGPYVGMPAIADLRSGILDQLAT